MLPIYHRSLQEYLSPEQIVLIEMLIRIIQIFKEIKIEKLAGRVPLPIKFESRRRAIQRFLLERALDISLLWLPIIKEIVDRKMCEQKHRTKKKDSVERKKIYLAMDRTQWQEHNILMIAIIIDKRAMPIYWEFLDKKGCSNLAEQQQVLRPVFKLFAEYKIFLLGDREFRGVHLAAWLTQLKIKYVFRIKEGTWIETSNGQRCLVNQLECRAGSRYFYQSIKLTKIKGFGYSNLAIYWKRKYRGKQPKEAWCLVTNLDSADAAIAAYTRRMGIEMMFRDCKLGGYHLEGSKASTPRLNRLVLLIAIAYTQACLQGNKYHSTSTSKYIGRDKKLRYDTSDTSRFWLGNYASDWLMMMDLMSNSVGLLMLHRPQHRLNFLKGLEAVNSLVPW
jgi:Transposase DDE domain